MPNCIQFIPKGSTEPMELNKIDEDLCLLFSEPIDPVNWLNDWFNQIAFPLAMGRSIDEVIERFSTNQRLEEISIYLRDTYTFRTFYQSKY
jgi:hypothetical protein